MIWIVYFDHYCNKGNPIEVGRFYSKDNAGDCAIELFRIVDGHYASPVVTIQEQYVSRTESVT